jgi:hypothetical protein
MFLMHLTARQVTDRSTRAKRTKLKGNFPAAFSKRCPYWVPSLETRISADYKPRRFQSFVRAFTIRYKSS